MRTRLVLTATTAWVLVLLMGTRASADLEIGYSFQIGNHSAVSTQFTETLSAGTYSYGGTPTDGGNSGLPIYLGVSGGQTVILSSATGADYSIIVSGNTDVPGSNGPLGAFVSDAELDTVKLDGDSVGLTVIATQTGYTTPTGSNLLLTDTLNSDNPNNTTQENVNNKVNGTLSASGSGQVVNPNTNAVIANAAIAQFSGTTPNWWEPQTASTAFANATQPFTLTTVTSITLGTTGNDVVLDNHVKVTENSGNSPVSATPEPSTLASAGCGALAAVLWAWRSRSRKKS